MTSLSKYKIEREDDGTYTIKDVPIFETHDNRGFDCNEKWLADAIGNFEKERANGHRPVVILGHNVKGAEEKKAKGFLDNLRLKGKKLYADITKVTKALKEDIVQNAYPSRSVEILPNSKKILALALLGGTAPFFSLPQMVYGQNEESLWYRSPDMPLNQPNNKPASVADIARQAAQEAVAAYQASQTEAAQGEQPMVYGLGAQDTVNFLRENPDPQVFQNDQGYFVTGEDGYYQLDAGIVEQYFNPINATREAATAVGGFGKRAGSAIASGARKAGAAIGTMAKNPRATAGAMRTSVAGATGRAASAARGISRDHPGLVAGGAALAGGVGYVGGRMHQAHKDNYQIDPESGVVYFNGEAVGEVAMYGDPGLGGQLPDPHAGGTPDLVIEEGAVGLGSGNTNNVNPVGPPQSMFTQEVDPESSDQFSVADQVMSYVDEGDARRDREVYQLRQELGRVQYDRELEQMSQRAEKYQSQLLDAKKKGYSIGNIKEAVDYMLGQTEEGAKQFMKILASGPKIALGPTQYSQVDAPEDAKVKAKQEYNEHRQDYDALGVRADELEYANFVRVNTFGAATPSNVLNPVSSKPNSQYTIDGSELFK